MSTIEHRVRYAAPSSLDPGETGARLRLSGSSPREAWFFRGTLTAPRVSALGLSAVADVVRARYHVPPGMLARILLEADPVVTAGQDALRFEGFSRCCSSYARLDVGPRGFQAEEWSPGTTNVDFQAPVRAALAGVRDGDDLALTVQADGVEVSTGGQRVVERKVPLPVRWIRGMGEVQAQVARMEKRQEVTGPLALRFLRGLPRSPGNGDAWVTRAGAGLRLSRRASSGAVPVSGVERLRVLEPLAARARSLAVYDDAESGSSAWVLHLEGQDLTVVISRSTWRGFSGEGQLLGDLARRGVTELVPRVRASLGWTGTVDPAELARALRRDEDAVRSALALLAARGLLGYDLVRGGYFYRPLPFDLDAVERLHPRLEAARDLVPRIRVVEDGDPIVAQVPSGSVHHRVTVRSDGTRTCTCPWYAKHRTERGPCKHVLAVEIHLEDAS